MREQRERVGSTPGLRRLIPVLLTEATQDPAFLELVTEGVIEPIRDVIRELVAIDGVPELEERFRSMLPVVAIDGAVAFTYFVDPDGLRDRLARPD